MDVLASTTPVDADKAATFARDVAHGLSCDPKRIPSRYLYDPLGSRLFEAICRLPWYTITRAEQGLLARHAVDIIGDLGDDPTLIELGAGSGEKLSLLLESSGADVGAATVHIIDISSAALQHSVRTLAKYRGVTVVSHETTYELGVKTVVDQTHGDGPVLVLFLGSNIGNMAPDEAQRFLGSIRAACRGGDRLLLGADLVKPERDLILAYDDPLGVTAAFNKNLLVRLNRELDGDFDVEQFDHSVVWNADAARVEAYLVSRSDQLVCLRGAGCCTSLVAGESIWTESSHKYELEQLSTMAAAAGLTTLERWVDADHGFVLTLLEASSSGSS